MRIKKTTRLTASTVLAFFVFLLTSMCLNSVKRQVGTGALAASVEINRLQPPTEDTLVATPENKKTKYEDTVTTRTQRPKIHHKATWYRTEGTRVHKEHSEIHGTAAYNFTPKGTRLKITNLANGKHCIVEVTDRMGNRLPGRIDLSHSAFGALENHARGAIKVTIEVYAPIIKEGIQTN